MRLNWKAFIVAMLLFFALSPMSLAHTVTVPTERSFGIPLYEVYIHFSIQQVFNEMHRENNFWYFDDYGVQVQGANMTITDFFSNEKFGCWLTAPTDVTSTTQIYVGNRGQPKRVDGATTYSYNDTSKIVTATVLSSQFLLLSWIVEGKGKYALRVHVNKDGLPVPFVNVTVKGQGSEHTGLFGVAEFALSSGTYFVEATVDGQTQNKTVTVHRDVSVGFEFYSLPTPSGSTDAVIVIIVVGVIIGVLFFAGRRRK